MVAALVVGLLLAACDEPAPRELAAPSAPAPRTEVPRDSAAVAILARARRVHGADVLDHAEVTFDFRDTPFTVRREGGHFTYARVMEDSARVVRDVLGNDGFTRTVDGAPVALPERERLAAAGAVNSVVYFALLPYSLADPAVRPRLIGADTLGGEPYHLVEVTFRKEGGGQDYQDRFVYWIHRTRATMDYLAYSYEVNGGGARFRQAVNPRTVGGVRFADYRNYTAEPLEPPLDDLGRLFEAESLALVSEIVLDRVRVVPVP